MTGQLQIIKRSVCIPDYRTVHLKLHLKMWKAVHEFIVNVQLDISRHFRSNVSDKSAFTMQIEQCLWTEYKCLNHCPQHGFFCGLHFRTSQALWKVFPAYIPFLALRFLETLNFFTSVITLTSKRFSSYVLYPPMSFTCGSFLEQRKDVIQYKYLSPKQLYQFSKQLRK